MIQSSKQEKRTFPKSAPTNIKVCYGKKQKTSNINHKENEKITKEKQQEWLNKEVEKSPEWETTKKMKKLSKKPKVLAKVQQKNQEEDVLCATFQQLSTTNGTTTLPEKENIDTFLQEKKSYFQNISEIPIGQAKDLNNVKLQRKTKKFLENLTKKIEEKSNKETEEKLSFNFLNSLIENSASCIDITKKTNQEPENFLKRNPISSNFSSPKANSFPTQKSLNLTPLSSSLSFQDLREKLDIPEEDFLTCL